MRLNAQHYAKTGILSYYNISKTFKKNWKITFNNQTRFPIYNGEFASKTPANIYPELSDFGVFVTKKIHNNHALGGLALLRFDGYKKYYRYNVHYIFSHKIKKIELSYRVVFDQTFNKNKAPIYRTRYRVSLLVPLKGQKLDNKEFYFKMSNEYFTISQAKTFDFEFRVFPSIGYKHNKKVNMELGLDYRLNEFIQKGKQSSNVFWINTGISINL